jgi:hypothetical protein
MKFFYVSIKGWELQRKILRSEVCKIKKQEINFIIETKLKNPHLSEQFKKST